MERKVKVAIAGVGNCASALVQGVEYYRSRRNAATDGVMRRVIGGYRVNDIEFVAAFDVDKRKVGRPLEEAIFAKPNCTRIFQSSLPVSNAWWSRRVPCSMESRRTWPTIRTTPPSGPPIWSRPPSTSDSSPTS
jgi:myo-inositol-1-phosphate synthase